MGVELPFLLASPLSALKPSYHIQFYTVKRTLHNVQPPRPVLTTLPQYTKLTVPFSRRHLLGYVY